MKIRINKVSFIEIVLFSDIIVQFFLLLLGWIQISSRLNSFLHMNCYIIACLIILTLVLKGGMDEYLAILFFAFYLVFLMGQKIFEKEKNVFLTFSRTELDAKQYYIFLTILSFGLMVTYLSYAFFKRKVSIKEKKVASIGRYVKDTSPILPIIRFGFFLTLPFAFYMQLKIVMVRSAISYVSGYVMNVEISPVIKIAYYLFTSFTMIYLAVKPSRKEITCILGMYLIINGGMQLFQGRRAFFASTLFFIIWYLIKYYGIKKINFKYIVAFILGIILLIVLFFTVEMQRDGVSSSGFSLIYIIKKFMISTGGSDSVIANAIDKADLFPKAGIWYVLDPIINNPITVILTGKSGITQGINYLANFNNFSHWISYFTEPSLYKSGHGMGSCYLAEIYVAFGCIGVFCVSIVIGAIISYMSKIKLKGSIFRNAIIFFMIQSLFTLPRSGLFDWVSDVTYFFVAFVLIYPFYNIYCKKWVLVEERE